MAEIYKQLNDNIRSLDIKLTPEEIESIEGEFVIYALCDDEY